jgi:purine-cytosine permease-like protein
MGLVILFGLFCTILALGGPVAVVRAWLERFAVWLVIASTAWITYGVFAGGVGSWGGFASQPAAILLGLDLVIAMPVSWWPLVSDYNRFGAQPRGASGGTFLGYAIANAWFFLLGAAMIVLLGATDVIASILSLSLGGVVLLLILVDETDNGFANLYSGAVSLQNLRPRSGQRRFVMAVAIVSIAIGVILAAGGGFNGPATLAYEGFLLLIGGAFVPLLGVLTTDAFVVRRRAAYRPEEFGQMSPTIRWESLAAWGTGAAAYFYLWWTNYGGGVGWPTLTIGLSLPAFAIACTIQYVLTRWAVPAAAGTRTVP